MVQDKKAAEVVGSQEKAARPAKVIYKGREIDPSINHPRARWGKTAKDRANRGVSRPAPVAVPEVKAKAKKK